MSVSPLYMVNTVKNVTNSSRSPEKVSTISVVKKGQHNEVKANSRVLTHLHEDDLNEPLLQENLNRYVMFPLQESLRFGLLRR